MAATQQMTSNNVQNPTQSGIDKLQSRSHSEPRLQPPDDSAPQSQHSQAQSADVHVDVNAISMPNGDRMSDDDEENEETIKPPPVSATKSSSTNDVLTSLRNKANEIARNSTRKLREIKRASLIKSKSSELGQSGGGGDSNEDNADSTNATANANANSSGNDRLSISGKLSKIKNKSSLFAARQKSKSSPSTPNDSDLDNDKKQEDTNTNPYDALSINGKSINANISHMDPARSSIIIGATYSHSDNEMIDSKLKSMQKKKRKKSASSFLRKKTSKAHSTHNTPAIAPPSNSNDDTFDKGNDGDVDDDKKEENDDNQNNNNDEQSQEDESELKENKSDISNMINFQFLKKGIDTTQMKSSMNAMLSQSSQHINKFIVKQKEKVQNVSSTIRANQVSNAKSTSYLKQIPQKCLELWKRAQEHELNRFAKMSAQAVYKPFHDTEKKDYFENSEPISWDDRIMTDIIRAGKLFVVGEVDEIFEFPSFKSTSEKQELVRTTIQYLEAAVQQNITEILTLNGVNKKKKDKDLNKDAAKEISVKSVRQSLISLCQEFVNDPYFKYLKESCEKYNLQPTDIGLVGNQDVKSIKSWTPRLCIAITGNRIYTHIVRVFQCYHVMGIEAVETQIYFGFKRTYSIDCLGGPPIILPPIFLAHDKEKSLAFKISIPKEKVLDPMHLSLDIPDEADFVPSKH